MSKKASVTSYRGWIIIIRSTGDGYKVSCTNDRGGFRLRWVFHDPDFALDVGKIQIDRRIRS